MYSHGQGHKSYQSNVGREEAHKQVACRTIRKGSCYSIKMVHECSIIQPRDSISDSKGARSRGRGGARLSFKDVTITYKKYTDGFQTK